MSGTTRRRWLQGVAASAAARAAQTGGEYQLFWGDLHNHNAVCYAREPGNWYMARVKQANGHQAWSSPVWVDG